jgi:hypothetical protein
MKAIIRKEAKKWKGKSEIGQRKRKTTGIRRYEEETEPPAWSKD